jgi:outer membrane translocation and assembly module TamA
VFADAGHAALKVRDLAIYSDVGFGLRVLIPQLNVEVIRFDWAFPLKDLRTAEQVFPAGWPGRLSVGFRQAF